MQVPLPILAECILGPKYFSKKAHAPHPDDLKLRVRKEAPKYVIKPEGNAEFNHDLIIKLKYSALGDWLILYEGIYDSSEKYEFCRLLADMTQEIMLLCHTPVDNLADYISSYDRDYFKKIRPFLPNKEITVKNNPFSNRSLPEPSSDKFYPQLSKLNEIDFKVVRYKQAKGEFNELSTDMGEVDLQEFAQMENQIKNLKGQRISLQNKIQLFLSEQNQITKQINELNYERSKYVDDYTLQQNNLTVQLKKAPPTDSQITTLETQRKNISNEQRAIISDANKMVHNQNLRKAENDYLFKADGHTRKKPPLEIFEETIAAKNKAIANYDKIIANLQANINARCIENGISTNGMPTNGEEIVQFLTTAIGERIQGIEDKLSELKEAHNKQQSDVDSHNSAINEKLSALDITHTRNLNIIDNQITVLNTQLETVQHNLKIEADLLEVSNKIVNLESKFMALQAGYDIQQELEAQQEADKISKLELEHEIEELSKTHEKRLTEFKKSIDVRHEEALKEIEKYEMEMHLRNNERDQELNNTKEELEKKHQAELTRLMTLLQQETNAMKKNEITKEINQNFDKKESSIKSLEYNLNSKRIDDKNELNRLIRVENENRDNDLWDLNELEKEPERSKQRLAQFDIDANNRLVDIKQQSSMETPLKLTYSNLLTRILKNIEHYYLRLYDELPLIYKSISIIPKMDQRYILEPRLFLNYHYSMLVFKDNEEADTYISDILVPPGGRRDVTITISRISKETTEAAESILTSTEDTAITSLVDTFNKQQGLKNSTSKQQEQYSNTRNNFSVTAKAEIPIKGVALNVNTDYNTASDRSLRTNNSNTKDTYADELQNTVTTNTNQVNRKNQREVTTKTTHELTESKESREFLTFINQNHERAMKIKFYQATQIHKCYIMLTDITFEFTNGFEMNEVNVRDIDDLPYNWGETGEEMICLDGLKHYIYLAGESITFMGDTYHFFEKDLERNPFYVFRMKNEDFYGVPIRYFTQNLLLDAVTTKTELDSTLLMDTYRKEEVEAMIRQTQLSNELLKEQVTNTEIRNKILSRVLEIIETKSQDVEISDAINAIIATTSQGIEYIQKPFTIDYLKKKKDSDVMLLDKNIENL